MSLLEFMETDGKAEGQTDVDTGSQGVSEATNEEAVEGAVEGAVEETTDGAVEGAEETSEEGTEESSELGLSLEQLAELTGLDLSPYQDTQSALKGLAEAKRLVGVKNEAAERWNALTELPREQQEAIVAILKGEQPSQAPSQEPSQGTPITPQSFEEYELLQKQVYDEQGNVRQNVDPSKVSALQKLDRGMRESLLKLATDPAAYFKEHFQSLGKELREEVLKETQTVQEKKLEEQRVMTEIRSIEEQHAKQLYTDAKNRTLTPFGEKVKAEFDDLMSGGYSDAAKALRKAISVVQASAPRPNGTKKVTSNGQRKPGVAVPPKKGLDLDKFFEEGGNLVSLAKELGE